MFIIEDERHGDWQDAELATFDEALAELRRLATIPWNERPNRCPCTQWRTGGRHYEIIEYDVSSKPWKELRRARVLEISAGGVAWIASYRIDY